MKVIQRRLLRRIRRRKLFVRRRWSLDETVRRRELAEKKQRKLLGLIASASQN